jgi:hypothetical protein
MIAQFGSTFAKNSDNQIIDLEIVESSSTEAWVSNRTGVSWQELELVALVPD